MANIGLLQILLWITLLTCTVAAQDKSATLPGPVGAYRVGAGDVLDIQVFEVEELSKPATVGPQGTLALPLIGEVPVAGMTAVEISSLLARLYGEDLLRDPQITVSVKDYHSQPVSVFGAVERPGIYQLQGPRRLLEVLAMAGGLAKDAGDEIMIEHRGEPPPSVPLTSVRAPLPAVGESGAEAYASLEPRQIRISIRTLLAGLDQNENPWIEPYDVVRVAKTGLIYVLGAVVRPGGYPIEQESMTVLRAISLAQGLANAAAPQKARVIRQDGASKQEIDVRVADILRGRSVDAELLDNDILFVPDSRAKSALHRGAEAAIQVATGVIIWRR